MNSLRHWGMGSTLAALAVVACSLALGITLTTTASNLWSSRELQAADQPLRSRLSNRDFVTPLETRIQETEQAISQLKDPVSIEEEKGRLAGLYRQLGAKSEVMGKFAHAEMSLQRAATLSPKAPEPAADLGRLYAEAARAQRDSQAKVQLLRNSTQSYQLAADRAPAPDQRKPYLHNASQVQYLLAKTLQESGQIEAAAHAMRLADQLAAGQ